MMRIKVHPQLAYIDGGLAAFIAQAAIAGILGSLLVMKGYWYRIKAYFSGGDRAQESEKNVDLDG